MQSRSKHTLSSDIGAGPFGASDVGDAFVKKRLNPADDMIPCVPIPDDKAYPSYTQQFRNQRVFSSSMVNNFSGEHWHADIVLVAHPLMCYLFHVWDDNGHFMYGCQMNNQLSSTAPSNPDNLTADEYYLALDSFSKQCEKYRCVYTSLTGNMVSSDMYNAGLVCAGQYVWEPADMFTNRNGPSNTLEFEDMKYPLKVFPDKLKDYSQLCQMASAYSSDAKDGFYMPLKIFENTYRNTNDMVVYTNDPVGIPVSWVDAFERSRTTPIVNMTIPTSVSPDKIFFPVGGTGGSYFANFVNMQFSSYYMGQISLRNISAQAQYMMTFRSGYELVTTPGSLFMQYVTPAPAYDPTAIVQYTQLVSMIQDAYPDSYNDWGLLKKKIQQAWQRIKPVAKFAGRTVLNHYVPGLGSSIFS